MSIDADRARPGPARGPRTGPRGSGRAPRRSTGRPRLAAGLIVLLGALTCLPGDLPLDARLALLAFGAATVLWTMTRLEAGYVALVAGLVACVPAGRQEEFFAALGHDVVWLIIGAFVIGGAMASSGLADRLTRAIIGRARTVRGLLWWVSAAIVPLAFLVPSTSGRAAVLLPVHRALADRIGDRRVARALSLLIPSVVLVSTTCTLVGATSHLVAVDLLHRAEGTTIGYAQWALWGVPFGLAASAVTCLVVQRMFLQGEELRRPLPSRILNRADDATPVPPGGSTARLATGSDAAHRREGPRRDERQVALIGAAALAGWLTEPLHGLEIATVTVLAALALCSPRIGVMTWKAGLAAVSWRLVLFVAGALALGAALVDSGAGERIIGALLGLSGLAPGSSPWAALAVIALLATTAHLYITSHTVRAIALIPPMLVLATGTGLSPVAVVFLVSIGLDYCLTLPVSSKALLLFTQADGDGGPGSEAGFAPRDLLRLSLVMLPAYLALMLLTYVAWWQHTGLAL